MTARFNRAILTILFLFFLNQAFPQLTGFRYFQLEKDNKSIKINCLYKSSNGYILVGSENGLYKFDGEKFIPVYFSNKDFIDTVTAIFQDNQQKIWVGFKSGRIAHVVNKKLLYFNPEEGTPRKKITAFLQDRENNIWFATAGEGIYYMKNGHMYLVNEEDGLSDPNVNTLALSGTGDILAGTDQGINSCNIQNGKKTISVIGTRSGLPDYIITGIVPAGRDQFWIGLQDKGFCLYDHASKKITVPAAVKQWEWGQVNALLPVTNTLWIATRNNGLLKYDANTDRLDSLPGNSTGNHINGLLQDNQGNVWLSSPDAGLIRTPGESIRLMPIPGSPAFEHVHAILSEKKGNIWLNNENNELIRLTRSNEKVVLQKLSLPGVTDKTDITSLCTDLYGHLWVGVMGKGLFIVDPSSLKYRPFTENPLFINAGILSISSKNNMLYVSSLQGSMAIELDESNKDFLQPYKYANYNSTSTGTNYIYSIFSDSRNRIWFATDGNGLTRLEDNRFTYFHEKNTIKDDHIYSVTEDKKGNIWFSTASAGIYKYDGKTFTNYGMKEGLSDLAISVLKTDRNGNIIIVHKKGLDILNPETGDITYLSSNQAIGSINAEDLGAVATDSAGNILVSTTKGILTWSPPPVAIQKPMPVIESVQLFLNDIDDNRSNRFRYDENNFTFNFTGLYYTEPERIYFRYMLQGLDSTWIFTKDRSKNFPKLQPGHYTFRLQASINRNFDNAAEASYAFVISKAFYKEYWFIVASILVAASLLYWYIRSREQSLKKMERLRQEKIQFEFEVLRTQVNPHFLFNSFNTLISTIEEDPGIAVEYAGQLSDFFRDIVNYRDKEVISLAEEISLLNNYYRLQQKRYGNNLQLFVNIPEAELAAYQIPPLTLQLLMENAIKHNVVSREKTLTISLEIIHQETLQVKNNINPRLSKQPGAGMGLQNIISRYNLLSNKKVTVINDDRYFIVSLPLLKK